MLPVLVTRAKTLPEAWENAVLSCWSRGISLPTEYDKPTDPNSKDCTALIVVEEPLAEPHIHRCFPGSLEDLEVYTQEVLYGIHDSWIKPEEGKWEYTYHERLRAFFIEKGGTSIDQVAAMTNKLAETPYTRRAQAITWKPWCDATAYDPPCLQRVWCRIVEDKLVMNVSMRSNDAFKASFMNMFAFIELQKMMAADISKKSGRTVGVGQYTHMADSFHIYGSYFKDFEGFLKTVKARSFEERTWTMEFAEPLFDEARRKLGKESAR